MTGVQVCQTVTAPNMAELRRQRDAAGRADLVELRLDGVADVDVAGALADRRAPVVVTCRPAWDGGRYDGSEETRLAWLAEAARLGAEYVDVEHQADWQAVGRSERTGLVLSFHDWRGVPADLSDRVRAMRSVQPAVTKVAVTATRLADCVALRRACAGDEATVAIAMGERGQVTRTCPWLFNSCWTYAGHAAPGQLSTALLLDRYRVRSGTADRAVYGVAGRPVSHSASPAMHNAAFAAAGLDAVYVAFDGQSAEDVDELASALGVKGLSVTAPFKQPLFARAAGADERTRALGAANTLRWNGTNWDARNFDVDGFLEPLDKRGIRLDGERAVVLGAGGAARAVVLALRERGARVSVAARRTEQAGTLAASFGVDVEAWPPRTGWRLLVNATPVGTWPRHDESPIDAGHLSGPLVYDLVYNPPETTLMRLARARGADAIGGLDMLVRQACLQFEWWTGRPAPHEVIAQAAFEYVTGEVRATHEADDV
jgi:3-dehydroquinate dehydratase/shikimate dehydrogenase